MTKNHRAFYRAIVFFCAATCLLSSTACDYLPFGYVALGDIVTNPTRYDGQRVKIKGTVSEVTKIPFLDVRLYALTDRGARIMVLARDGIPAVNSEVTVIGVVENVAVVNNESIGLHLREMKRLDPWF
jgi:hypothetical protein